MLAEKCQSGNLIGCKTLRRGAWRATVLALTMLLVLSLAGRTTAADDPEFLAAKTTFEALAVSDRQRGAHCPIKSI